MDYYYGYRGRIYRTLERAKKELEEDLKHYKSVHPELVVELNEKVSEAKPKIMTWLESGSRSGRENRRADAVFEVKTVGVFEDIREYTSYLRIWRKRFEEDWEAEQEEDSQ